ncbi:MAG: endonuclease NucS domain-containing protein, partial [Sedimentisphaerales bacterium]
MKEIKLWKIKEDANSELNVENIENVKETQTEQQLEEVITRCPGLIMEDLKLIGRQTETLGGPLDLLGVDSDGRLVVFELKRGILTREAIAQIIDYSSHLVTLPQDELSEHISSRSGKLGIDKIDNFLVWYQEQFGKEYTEYQRPRMVLIGLGADERTKRMASFLSESDLDISLITFHGFKQGEDVFLARQVEVRRPPDSTTAFTKKSNLEKLRLKVKSLSLDNYYYDIATLFRNQLPPSYEWPNPGGYSYGLPELTESGGQSNRVYIALYIHDSKPGVVQICLYHRAVDVATSGFEEFEKALPQRLKKKNDGSYEMWVQ